MKLIEHETMRAFTELPVAALRAHVVSLIAGRSVALLDWPDYANAGDHLIWLGQKILLQGAAESRIRYETSLKNLDFHRLCTLPADCVLIVSGGGNFGDLYPYHQRFREAIAAVFPERRIIFMPQSVCFTNLASLRRSRRILSRHRDLHAFARDWRSLRIMRYELGIRHSHLGIDAAFFLGNIVNQLQARFPNAGAGIVRLMRQDNEACPRQRAHQPAADIKDWASTDNLSAGGADPLFDLSRCGIKTADAFQGELDRVSWRRLCGAVELFSPAGKIITDRLHAHILSIMMNKPHMMLDNTYGKLGDFYQTWEVPYSAPSWRHARRPRNQIASINSASGIPPQPGWDIL